MLDLIKQKRVLLVGTGGGNDICSTTLIAAYLRPFGVEADIAGICSPAAAHFYGDLSENTINRVTADSRRVLLYDGGVKINFIDRLLPDLCRDHGLSGNVFNFSLAFGTEKLIRDLNEFVEKQGYEMVVAVDVGGDILARGAKDPSILSPLMDFGCLYVLSKIDAPTLLLEFGLQTDGELRPKGCGEILFDLEQTGALLDTNRIFDRHSEVRLFSSIYSKISGERAGNTGRMTLMTLRSSNDILSDYRQTYRIFDKKWVYWHKVLLEKKYFGKLYSIDLKKMASDRVLAFPFLTPFEQTIKTKLIVDTKTEMDLLYTPCDIPETNDVLSVWLGLPSPTFPVGDRKEMIQYGLEDLPAHADVAVIWKSDQISSNLQESAVGPFLVLSDSAEKSMVVCNQIKSWL